MRHIHIALRIHVTAARSADRLDIYEEEEHASIPIDHVSYRFAHSVFYICKKSILNLKFVEVRRFESRCRNPGRLHPELVNPSLNQTLNMFGTPGM